jgi:hypothetical protein
MGCPACHHPVVNLKRLSRAPAREAKTLPGFSVGDRTCIPALYRDANAVKGYLKNVLHLQKS